MTGRRRFVEAGLVVASVALAGLALAACGGTRPATSNGPGMMNGNGRELGGAYGSATSGRTSASPLGAVRNRVQGWLHSRGFTGFRVSEVMAFANNDYVAVQDPKGRPAFELLTARNLRWLMEEPPSMMWNTRYGMMRGFGFWSSMGSMMGGGMGSMMGGGMMGASSWSGWYHTGQGAVRTVGKAAKVANRWLRQARPSERVESDVGGMGHFPGYYTLDTTRNGKTVGMLSVNASTGDVWYHGWHGTFLTEREF